MSSEPNDAFFTRKLRPAELEKGQKNERGTTMGVRKGRKEGRDNEGEEEVEESFDTNFSLFFFFSFIRAYRGIQ